MKKLGKLQCRRFFPFLFVGFLHVQIVTHGFDFLYIVFMNFDVHFHSQKKFWAISFNSKIQK